MIVLLLAGVLASPGPAASCAGPACGGCVRPADGTGYEARYVE